MLVDFITLRNFVDSYPTLGKMHQAMSRTYEAFKHIIEASKENNIPLIGNPIVKLQNELIELSYLLRQHQLNCTVFLELIEEKVVIDQEFVQQLNWLLAMTQDISCKYELLKEKMNELPVFNGRRTKAV